MLSTIERIDPRTVRTRALLLDAFGQLLGEKSFEELTVQDITARATVNRATFYAHFPDKYALLDEMMATAFARSLERRLTAPAHNTHTFLRQLFLAVTDHLSTIGTRCQRSLKTFEALMETQIKTDLRMQVRSWVAEQPELRAQSAAKLDVVATLLSWSIYGAAIEWRKQTVRQPADAFADEVVPLFAATIATLAIADSRLKIED
jgi:AcrR family transcriptional regulator